jgi:DNA-binding transcriptional MerR regulator
MTEPGPHLSIGEVLAQLREEFSDITISKIRFLESQGLVDPERTASGYRKFYAGDLARLRWILFQQKEHFLPLKVIKERLDEVAPGEIPADTEEPAESAAEAPATRAPARKGRKKPAKPARRAVVRTALFDVPTLPLAEAEREPDEPVTARTLEGGVSLTRSELARATGLDDDAIAELESYGLLVPASEAGDRVLFDEEGLAVSRLAAGFAAHGIGARHLRMYKTFAEREAVLFGQVLLPYLRQRNPDARSRAQKDLAELARLGGNLRGVLLRGAVHESLSE